MSSIAKRLSLIFSVIGCLSFSAVCPKPVKKNKRKKIEFSVQDESLKSLPAAACSDKSDFLTLCKPVNHLGGDDQSPVHGVIHGDLLIHQGSLAIKKEERLPSVTCKKNCFEGDVKKEIKKIKDLSCCENDDPLNDFQKSCFELNLCSIVDDKCNPVKECLRDQLSLDTEITVPQFSSETCSMIQGSITNFDPRRDVFLIKFNKSCLRAGPAVLDLSFQTVLEPNRSLFGACGVSVLDHDRFIPVALRLDQALIHPALIGEADSLVCHKETSFFHHSESRFDRVNSKRDTCLLSGLCKDAEPEDCLSLPGQLGYICDEKRCDSLCHPSNQLKSSVASYQPSLLRKKYAELMVDWKAVECGQPEWLALSFFSQLDYCFYGLKSELLRETKPLTEKEVSGRVCYSKELLQDCPRSFFRMTPGTIFYKIISCNLLDCLGGVNPNVVSATKCDLDLACCLAKLGLGEDCLLKLCEVLQQAECKSLDLTNVKTVSSYLAKYEYLFKKAPGISFEKDLKEEAFQAIVRSYQKRSLNINADNTKKKS